MTPLATPATVPSKMPSKGPPPLPPMATPTPAPHEGAARESVFEEGIDGRADSLPGSGEYEPPPDARPISASTEGASKLEEAWFEPNALGEEEEEEKVEDPAQTRRRRAARVGLAYGAVLTLAIGAVGALANHRGEARSAALSSSPTQVETVATPPAAVAVRAPLPGAAPTPVTAAVVASRSPVRATTASVAATAPAAPRAGVRKGSPASPATHPASKAPKAPRARETRPLPRSAPNASPKRSHR